MVGVGVVRAVQTGINDDATVVVVVVGAAGDDSVIVVVVACAVEDVTMVIAARVASPGPIMDFWIAGIVFPEDPTDSER